MLRSYLTTLPHTKFVLIEGQVHVSGENVILHDFASDVCGWDTSKNKEDLESVASRLNAGDVVIVDSLAHAIFQYGLAETYRVFNLLKTKTGVQQIITLFHTDLVEDKDKLSRYFEHLSTLSICIEPKFISGNGRVHYTYKKLGGKIIKQIEEYKFEGEEFVTQKIEKPDPKKLLESSMRPEVDPETLTTFKIGLTDTERESRDKLDLPYV
ncbi:hypothetical protein NQ314_011177 [Rhamnusium bicolor]|uniref:Elongator complex protein 5 n=1 Tax=Rhamnusium bicolor TaxID=1586634 RepID=A0AAV8XL84_9CUCU|nr:hypothetical protein NQ314_011177 [Rhamnusium bicolor]